VPDFKIPQLYKANFPHFHCLVEYFSSLPFEAKFTDSRQVWASFILGKQVNSTQMFLKLFWNPVTMGSSLKIEVDVFQNTKLYKLGMQIYCLFKNIEFFSAK